VNTLYRESKGPLHLLIDSTGIKFRGDGEWLARRAGTKQNLAHDPAPRKGALEDVG
jgi:hypothetical protein